MKELVAGIHGVLIPGSGDIAGKYFAGEKAELIGDVNRVLDTGRNMDLRAPKLIFFLFQLISPLF